jgi:hypothetical protein
MGVYASDNGLVGHIIYTYIRTPPVTTETDEAETPVEVGSATGKSCKATFVSCKRIWA